MLSRHVALLALDSLARPKADSGHHLPIKGYFLNSVASITKLEIAPGGGCV